MPADLHLHSTFSDGFLDIKDILKFAHNARLSHVSVTDHDTPKSIQYALKYSKYKSINLVPGVEISCKDNKRNQMVHILCYYPQITNDFLEMCNTMAASRNKVAYELIETVKSEFPLIPWENLAQYSKQSGVVFKTHIMRLLQAYGYTLTLYGELFDSLFLDENRNEKIKAEYTKLEDALEIIKGMRGVCVVAHPGVYNNIDLCEELGAKGLIDGIEVYHMHNTEEHRTQLLRIAKNNNLIITGGTDFHGAYMPKPLPIGSNTTSEEQLLKIQALANKRAK